jgi:serpin B
MRGTGITARAAAALAIAAMVAGACGGAGATPASSGHPASPASASPLPATGQPYQSFALDDFTVIKGVAKALSPADDQGSAAAAELNDFGFDLLRRMDANGNLCASPTSIALALAMVEPGAKGATAAEMAKVMHGFGAAGQASEVLALLRSLQSKTFYMSADGSYLLPGNTPDPAAPDPVVELNVANQAFLQKGLSFEQQYLDSLSAGFDSGIGVLDFQKDHESARLAINNWAGKQTKGRIPSILQPDDIKDSTRFALANAIYLKAAWNHKFDKANTKSRDFTTAGGSKVSVPTMAADQHLAYSAGPGYRAVELPYSGGTMSMTIIVPDDMAAFVAGLSQTRLAALTGAETEYDVDFTLPKFSVDTRVELADTLIAMGMPTVFSDGADLSGMAAPGPLDPDGLKIDKVIHQANIDVVEDGTTAAAVTVVVGAAAGAAPAPPPHVQFHVDKPFLYLIRDSASGAVLFMGRVDDPSK